MQIDQILKAPLKKNTLIKILDGTGSKSKKSTADAFANHLVGVFQPFDSVHSVDLTQTVTFLDSPCHKTFFTNEVTKEIKNLVVKNLT